LSPKRTPFQTGIHLWKVPRRRWTRYTYPTDCEIIAYLRFRHMGQFFMKPSDSYDTPINIGLHFIVSVGLMKRGNISLKVTPQGPDYYGPPLIHSLFQMHFIRYTNICWVSKCKQILAYFVILRLYFS
jgi:hypothetical protein